MSHRNFEEAARHVLSDDSMHAAQALEGVLLVEYADDDRVEDLLEALAL